MVEQIARLSINRLIVLFVGVMGVQGCANSVGPGAVEQGRFNYNLAIADSWKNQTLLNIVKLRYSDMPVFIDVASVTEGQTFSGSVSAEVPWLADAGGAGDLEFGSGMTYSNAPTIQYRPITGQKFNTTLMTPIPPKAMLFLVQAGWPIDLVFPLTVDSINGLRAPQAVGEDRYPGDPAFERLVARLKDVQASDAVGMHVERRAAARASRSPPGATATPDEPPATRSEQQVATARKKAIEAVSKEVTVMFFYRQEVPAAVRSAMDEIYRILGLDAGKDEFEVVYGQVPQSRNQIAIRTLTMLQMLVRLAGFVDVPREHIDSGRTVPAMGIVVGDRDRRLMSIHQGLEEPAAPFVSARYRGRWYWIDNTDFKSKRVFTFLMILFSLAETAGKGGLPQVTSPSS